MIIAVSSVQKIIARCGTHRYGSVCHDFQSACHRNCRGVTAQHVVTITAKQPVCARPAVKHIRTGSAIQRIGITARKIILLPVAYQYVCPISTHQQVLARAAKKLVITSTAVQHIGPSRCAVDKASTVVAKNHVIALPAVQQVGFATTLNLVITGAAINVVLPVLTCIQRIAVDQNLG